MMGRKSLYAAAMLAVLVGLAVRGSTQGADRGDTAAVKQAVDQFYKALNVMLAGDAGPMTEVWSHADDVTYMGPMGGAQVGWGDIHKVWQEQAEKKLGGKIAIENLQLFVGEQIAVAEGVEAGFNLVDGKRQDVRIRTTNVFRKEQGAWKMVGHHTDLLPFLSK